jgi:hypothetical protein
LLRLSFVSELGHQSLFLKSAHLDNKPGQKYRQYCYVKHLGLTKPTEHWYVSTEKPNAKITDSKNAKEKEEKTAFGFESSPKSPHYDKNYQIP